MTALPKFHETFIPILKTLQQEGALKSRTLASMVRDQFYPHLSPELLQEKTSSGANVLLDRILWGKSYLKMGKFVQYPSRGRVEITPKGELALKSGKLSLAELKDDPDFRAHQNLVAAKGAKDKLDEANLDSASPQDLIDFGISKIKSETQAELLERLKELDPYYFEKLVLQLLQRMGYGDFMETPKSGDGGIDGIINEDKLGLEKIYTQAKRYNNSNIRETDIRNFIGAMSGDTRKGIFITTSSFDAKAIQKAKDAHHSIILIDGARLVSLMYEYNVGVQIKETYEVKEIDNDFFEEG
ncbi:restriction endonuclease [Croceimicrobium hydrocarbonivorans]|uniref:Restriction endonuclease n=1 Tax=Croceimicrobium hydrocarbonivorans TaxID=2761580 RepID=A0A7H0VD65_9FLAO|nr:restriction endonuclease [Croceimicrobium hydrocarbonivorans]QNR23663.1 restriction endonuclease [Croceimicrobium hydrocarbonivorans]